MEKREELQKYYHDKYLESEIRKVLYSISVRVGKTRIACNIAKSLGAEKVLILYPFEVIKDAWESEWEKIGWKPEEVIYSTYLSTRKNINTYDIIYGD